MDSKEGIDKVAPADDQAVGLLDPSHPWSGADKTETSPHHTRMNPPQGMAQLDHLLHWMVFVSGNSIACIFRF